VSLLRTRDSQFWLDGAPFYASGANTHYLPYSSEFMVDSVLDSAVRMGLRVVRTWAFFDTPAPAGTVWFQSWEAGESRVVYNDGRAGLQKLDYVIAQARARGLKVVLALTNNWPDYGGVEQYASWFGLRHRDRFYADERTRQAYRDWVTHVLQRVNVYTGTAYREDDAIMAWELANEPRCPGDPDTLVRWIGEMSSWVKQIDPQHLVCAGDEGFFCRPRNRDWMYDGSTGGDYDRILQLPSIDFGTFHLYPEAWKRPASFGKRWIAEHLEIAAAAGKPALLEEYGWRDPQAREAVYESWLSTVAERTGAGDLFWMLAGPQDDGTPYPDYDGFTMHTNRVPGAIRTHAAKMAGPGLPSSPAHEGAAANRDRKA
jgi:mannan endo-1,4-beta-mannosidase